LTLIKKSPDPQGVGLLLASRACGWRLFVPQSKESAAMKRFFAPALVLLVATASLLAAELKSGLQVGDAAGVFNVRDITGPNKGTTLCYR